MHPILSIRQRAAQRELSDLPTQTTDAIKPVRPIRLIHTDALPVVQPPATKVIHLGSVLPSLVELTEISALRVLTGFRMAYLHQRIELNDAIYTVNDVYPDPACVGKILARLEREDA